MRDPVRQTTRSLPTPSRDAREVAAAGTRSLQEHAELVASWDCLTHVELRQPPVASKAAQPNALTVAAWNMERCKRVPQTADLLRQSGADIVLATEMDHGMARSGQHHTTRDLA
ncbi:MAG: endonuclease, partial [Pseudomonadota bacterium]